MDLADLLARFRAEPTLRFAPPEVALLAAAADDDLDAARAFAFHAARSGDHETTLRLARRIAELQPSSATLMNVAIALRHLGRFADARDWALAHRDAIDPVELSGFLCTMAAYSGDEAEAVRWGNESLRLRDAQASAVPPLDPVVRAFDPERPERNIIAFSLWGADRRYLAGAMANVQVIPYLYPGWTPRFYVDGSVPEAAVAALMANGAQAISVGNMPPDRYGMFWRLLVEDDENVDIFIVRDADSVCNVKERWAVSDWLKAGTAFHVMRDHPVHCELMLGGMWGAHRGNIGRMGKRVGAFVNAARGRANRAYDQEFLRREIWPIARQSLTAHDSFFSLGEPRRYDPAFALPRGMHIGQNEIGRIAGVVRG